MGSYVAGAVGILPGTQRHGRLRARFAAPEGADLLRLTIVDHAEIIRAQIHYRLPLAVQRNDVETDGGRGRCRLLRALRRGEDRRRDEKGQKPHTPIVARAGLSHGRTFHTRASGTSAIELWG